jgi:adenylate cyclase
VIPSGLHVRLRERKLVQWALAYVAGAWALLQVAALLSDTYAWPTLFMRSLPVILLVGFFAALVVGWYHGEKGAQSVSTIEIAMLSGILVLAGVGVVWIGRGAAPIPVVASGIAPPAETGTSATETSIAVLPFTNMSSDPEQEYFSDGLSEELLNVLAQLPELRVASRTSAFAFKGKDVGIDSIARALKVAHVLEGSVRKAGDRVRITAQLIEARSGYHLWSQTYDRELRDIFAVQDEISRAIVGQLRITISGDAPLARAETTDPEAHALLLRGMSLSREGTREARLEGERLYREAIRRDPDYARAHALLGRSLMWQAFYRYIPPRQAYAEARAAAEHALALDPRLIEAHTVLGYVAERLDRDRAAADEHYRRALAVNRDNPDATYFRALLLSRSGRHEEALTLARRAVQLDPLGWLVHNVLGIVYGNAGEPERAIEFYGAASALAPRASTPVSNLASAYSRLGRHEAAIEAADRALALEPHDLIVQTARLVVYARAGRREEVERGLADLRTRANVSPYRVARIYAVLGDRERAFAMLERAAEEGDDNATDLGTSRDFDPLRQDARFDRLLRRLELPLVPAAGPVSGAER